MQTCIIAHTINKTLNSNKCYETAQFNEACDVILAVEALTHMQDQLVDRNTLPPDLTGIPLADAFFPPKLVES